MDFVERIPYQATKFEITANKRAVENYYFINIYLFINKRRILLAELHKLVKVCRGLEVNILD